MAIRDILDERSSAPRLLRPTIDDQNTNLGLPLAQSARATKALAREQQWAEARAIYSDAVAAFRRAIGIWRRVQSTRSTGRAVGGRTHATRARSLARALVQTTTLPELTSREREVTELVARGLSNRDIAHELVIEAGTVANHVAHILSKCGVSNRTQLAALVTSSQTEAPKCTESALRSWTDTAGGDVVGKHTVALGGANSTCSTSHASAPVAIERASV
jgi:DNA-binding CsgD family transcriptional regulator